ncbi:hypothetical protein A4X09_0g6697 [Tilletia walkeri]|uniref:Elongator complex protein 4 n=1 Tax=Tilletia walkeri TaxID=117179 RepID=A0A8X7N252_9BASI|nr:hypothetical protein A4X09_0g6697 [Tilletia walkeri]
MSSFKRRTPAATASATVGIATTPTSCLPIGLRPSPTSSLPQPLLSTGITALDDLIAGRGIPSSTTLLLIPEDYASSSVGDPWTVIAAEPYTDLILAYGIAQGIAHQHTNIIIGQQPALFCNSLMAKIGDGDIPPTTTTAAQSSNDTSDQLKIAFRYANLPILNSSNADQDDNPPSTSSTSTAKDAASKEFPSTFDLSRRISPQTLEDARKGGFLHCVDVAAFASEESGAVYDQAWAAIQDIVNKLKLRAEQSPDAPPPVLRIHIRALGSPAWHPTPTSISTSTDQSRFLLRLKHLLRSLSVPSVPGMQSRRTTPLIPSIATLTLSPYALTTTSSGTEDVAHRLSSIADTALALSSFDARPSLRHLLVAPSSSSSKSRKSTHGYTGAIRVLRSAAGVGGWPNEVVRASVLRGMSSSSASSADAGGGGGAGENDLAFRVGRKKLTVELLNVDDVGLAKREEQDLDKARNGKEVGGGDVLKMMEELRVKEEELRVRAAGGGVRRGVQVTSPTPASTSPAAPPARTSQLPTTAPKTTSSFKLGGGGLASLRAKGLAARAAASSSNEGRPPAPVVVELEGAEGGSGAGRGAGGAGTGAGMRSTGRKPVFEKRADQLEF